eukprot:GEMP01034651.1.p1 GENE.GEMP01034651.1~~GEMP01034651.1.p1  ORF type:complete len:463 (+),score=93.42 GEMP01034651.1:106-1494(+)
MEASTHCSATKSVGNCASCEPDMRHGDGIKEHEAPPYRNSTAKTAALDVRSSRTCASQYAELDNSHNSQIFAFVNSKSGDQRGPTIIRVLKRFLVDVSPQRGDVCDLSIDGPAAFLRDKVAAAANARILVCGGDGTITWMINAIAAAHKDGTLSYEPPMATFPLGIGNDLARSLGWGSSGSLSKLARVLDDIDAAEVVELDQWKITITPQRPLPSTHKLNTSNGSHPQRRSTTDGEVYVGYFQSYFSVGMDARVTNSVDRARNESRCAHCTFRSGVGKGWYGWYAFVKTGMMWTPLMPLLTNKVRLSIDNHGTMSTVLLQNHKCHASIRRGRVRQLSFCNINSYAGGHVVYGEDGPEQKPNDGLLEVLSARNGWHGTEILCRLTTLDYVATTSKVVLETQRGEYMQVDGEPWHMPCPAEVRLERHKAVRLLRAPPFAPDWGKKQKYEFWTQSMTYTARAGGA